MQNLILREAVVALVLIALVLIIAIIFNAPLGAKANPGLSPNPTKAPWYFAGFQELLMHFHPYFALLVIPVATLLVLLLIPYRDYQSDPAGIWFRSLKGRMMALTAAITGLAVGLLWILTDEYFFRLQGVSSSSYSSLIPFIVITSLAVAFTFLIKKKYNADRHETIQAVFVLFLTLFLFLMLINIWFRGPGMKLMWPWQVVITRI